MHSPSAVAVASMALVSDDMLSKVSNRMLSCVGQTGYDVGSQSTVMKFVGLCLVVKDEWNCSIVYLPMATDILSLSIGDTPIQRPHTHTLLHT
jgi:hypothetical protein